MGLTREQRIEAIVGFRFTERQARFLELVMRHGGVCVPRQYARFAGVANGGESAMSSSRSSCSAGGPFASTASTTERRCTRSITDAYTKRLARPTAGIDEPSRRAKPSSG